MEETPYRKAVQREGYSVKSAWEACVEMAARLYFFEFELSYH